MRFRHLHIKSFFYPQLLLFIRSFLCFHHQSVFYGWVGWNEHTKTEDVRNGRRVVCWCCCWYILWRDVEERKAVTAHLTFCPCWAHLPSVFWSKGAKWLIAPFFFFCFCFGELKLNLFAFISNRTAYTITCLYTHFHTDTQICFP